MTYARPLGQFMLSRKQLLEPDSLVKRIMSQCVVIDVIPDIVSDRATVRALCDRWFRPIDLGETTPSYIWVCRDDGWVEAKEV